MYLKSKFITWLLLITVIFAFSGCGAKEDTKETNLEVTAQWLQEKVPNPQYGSVGGEWLVFGLARSSADVAAEYFDTYYQNLENVVSEYEGVLDSRKYTEYSRTVIALTALEKNPEDVCGYNLLAPLANFEKTIFQGMNGPVFALLALDSGDYEVPVLEGEGIQANREMYIEYILEHEVSGGGWSLAGGTAEVDMTAMVLQALAKYQERENVAEATKRGLAFLSSQQMENGGFSAYGAECSETVSQVIVALTELGISLDDARFVKGGHSLKDHLLLFMTEEGAFSHTLEADADLMATEQAFYALTALERAEQGRSSLYRVNSKDAVSKASAEESKELVCTLEINCEKILEQMDDVAEGKRAYIPKDGIILEKTQIAFEEGENVFDVLCRVCKEAGIQLEYSWTPVYDSYYIEGIQYIYEFDCGGQSGWMYQVNDVFPNYGCSSYEVKPGDEIVWCYTCDGLGNDLGPKME